VLYLILVTALLPWQEENVYMFCCDRGFCIYI